AHEAAIASAWNAALARYPDDLAVLQNASHTQHLRDERREAIVLHALELAPDDPYWHHALGAIRRNQGRRDSARYREASAASERAASLTRNHGWAYWAMQAMSCAELGGDTERACTLAEAILASDEAPDPQGHRA